MEWIERLGFPTAISIGMGYAVFRICGYLAPVITKIAENHVALVEAIKVQAERTADAVEALVARVSGSETMIRDIHQKVTKGD